MQTVRSPAVAGFFYPGKCSVLEQTVRELMQADHAFAPTCPKALIAPHAGYVYSGAVAAAAYRQLEPWSDAISRVLLLGPAHRVAVRGLAASSHNAFATPLGTVEVDTAAVQELVALPQISVDNEAHAAEHSLEVHLPFLQMVLREFTIVPLVVGGATAAEVEAVVATMWARPGQLIVVSTDLSHFLDYEAAVAVDGDTDAMIQRFDYGEIGPERACGCRPLSGLLRCAENNGARIERLGLCNSGDTAGTRDRVVGYAAYALH